MLVSSIFCGGCLVRNMNQTLPPIIEALSKDTNSFELDADLSHIHLRRNVK